MDVLGKIRSPEGGAAGAAPARSGIASTRRSNGLKDFLWLMPSVEPPSRLLDLGPVSQATVSFFTERGFRVSTEDLVRCWAEFEAEWKSRQADSSGEEPDLAARAADFLKQNLLFEPGSFHGILAWDIFDFLEPELMGPLSARLHGVLAPGGVLLAAFHDILVTDAFHYRVRDGETIELVPARRAQEMHRVFQNREIMALFSSFRSSRTFVGRDHLREALFLK